MLKFSYVYQCMMFVIYSLYIIKQIFDVNINLELLIKSKSLVASYSYSLPTKRGIPSSISVIRKLILSS